MEIEGDQTNVIKKVEEVIENDEDDDDFEEFELESNLLEI